MSLEQTEQEKIKKAVLEILMEQPDIIKPILLKVLTDEKGIQVIQQALHKLKISANSTQIFKKYDDVFKALA